MFEQTGARAAIPVQRIAIRRRIDRGRCEGIVATLVPVAAGTALPLTVSTDSDFRWNETPPHALKALS